MDPIQVRGGHSPYSLVANYWYKFHIMYTGERESVSVEIDVCDLYDYPVDGARISDSIDGSEVCDLNLNRDEEVEVSVLFPATDPSMSGSKFRLRVLEANSLSDYFRGYSSPQSVVQPRLVCLPQYPRSWNTGTWYLLHILLIPFCRFDDDSSVEVNFVLLRDNPVLNWDDLDNQHQTCPHESYELAANTMKLIRCEHGSSLSVRLKINVPTREYDGERYYLRFSTPSVSGLCYSYTSPSFRVNESSPAIEQQNNFTDENCTLISLIPNPNLYPSP